eukprot:381239_1
MWMPISLCLILIISLEINTAYSVNSTDSNMEPVCVENVCWNYNNSEINKGDAEIKVEHFLSSLIEIFKNNSMNELGIDETLLSRLDEYVLGLIIYNWWYTSSSVGPYLGIACVNALNQNETLIYSLLKHNYNEEMGFLYDNPSKKHSLLLRNTFNAILSLLNLPLIAYNDYDLYYLPSKFREIYILTQSYELRRSMFNIYNNGNMLHIICSLIYFELQAAKQEYILWKILIESKVVKSKISDDILANVISPYFTEHLYTKQEQKSNTLPAEETHAIHALVMAKKMCLLNENNCHIIKNAFLLEMTLEANVLNAIFDAAKRKMINYNYIKANLYL